MNSLLKGSVLLALFGLTLAACSPSSATKPAPSSASPTADKQMMDHSHMGSMGDSMGSMSLGPADTEFDLRFIDAMTPHHKGAVEMAQDALQKSQRPQIKQLAQAIIADQNREINQLKQWRQAWYPNVGSTPVAYSSQMGHTMPMSQEQMQSMMMNGDLGPANAQYDLRFINLMLPHHEGAVVMAQEALSKSQRPEVKRLAQSIIASQQREINQMKQWRQQWYGQ
ncbi:DUF305 domain-containing protein [Leptolyngbya sp. FACHB-261]|uniref:DUF305 domain-containing protein n=1 Tax=Leptolyngbya sp. FACHB-261 TaxID=2692806 RepID=UPI0016869825|nr:DUF305 domain-containing protein [Leptolyngbya sp. FACHB-261]MBD2103066.1 DUF305 domain-containing protein [Leptolyngbya sp. FACHB-261]